MIPRYMTGWYGEEWRIRPLMTRAEYEKNPVPTMYASYEEYVKHSQWLNRFLDEPENADLLNRERVR